MTRYCLALPITLAGLFVVETFFLEPPHVLEDEIGLRLADRDAGNPRVEDSGGTLALPPFPEWP